MSVRLQVLCVVFLPVKALLKLQVGGKQKILRFAEMCHKLFLSAMHLQNAIGTGSLLILAAGSASKCEQMIIFWEDSHQPT